MSTKKSSEKIMYFPKFTSRKNNAGGDADQESFATWMAQYQQLAVAGVRSAAVAHKIALHLERFRQFFLARYGHEQIATCLRRDVHAWQTALREEGLAPATINNHLASLSAFTTWVHAHAPDLFAVGDRPRAFAHWACRP